MTTIACTRRLPGVKRECRTAIVLTVGSCHRCAWQQSGRCWQCGATRTTSPRGIYCDRCRVEVRRENERRSMADDQVRLRKLARARKRYRVDANAREQKRETRSKWAKANPDRVKLYKRRAALNPTPRRKEREQYHNSRPERVAKKRAQALQRYYELHPVRPSPMCRVCQKPIEWSPPGRPPVLCDEHVPASHRNRRKRAHAVVGAPV